MRTLHDFATKPIAIDVDSELNSALDHAKKQADDAIFQGDYTLRHADYMTGKPARLRALP
jgi:hypothetical protein